MSFIKRFAVELCGIATSLITVAIIVAIEHYFDISIFTWMVWWVIPVGALACGAAAASGYYFGAIHFDRRPAWTLGVSMVLIAGGTYFLNYYVSYVLYAPPGMSFADFFVNVLTTSRVTVQHLDPEGTEAGGFGFVLGAVQFIAFMVGGLWTYLMLRKLPACERCDRYFRSLFKVKKRFDDDRVLAAWQSGLDSADIGSAQFASLLREPGTPKGSVYIECSLLACSECDTQLVIERGRTHDGRNMVAAPMHCRDYTVPRGTSLREAFHAATAAR
jgi:hypothetical protein